MGTRSSRPTEPPSTVPPSVVPLATIPSSDTSDDSSDTSSGSIAFPLISTPPPTTSPTTTPTTPPRTTPPSREDCIRNLVAESRGCNQLDILIHSHGEPTLIADPDHSGLDSLMEEINTMSKHEFNKYMNSRKLKTLVHEVLLWDNRVAFSVKDPDTDEVVIFRIYHR